jgi:hypothetical protein
MEEDGYDDLEELVYDVNDDDEMNPDGEDGYGGVGLRH